ncbi:MAG: uncharacterized glyoxalase superfamily protein PhnB/uncharacterized protein (DUF952 family) [Gammaproteobacteria bacterium]|jgi:uncharacterized glyoxalase superfamily protein PhnB/uncharacterized protein (DUF952 family)
MAKFIPTLVYKDAPRAIAWLEDAFGFKPRMIVREAAPGRGRTHTIVHSQLNLGESLIMVSSAGDRPFDALHQPGDVNNGAVTQSPHVVVPDADVAYLKAKGAGATMVMDIVDEPHGGRGFSCKDIEGHLWNFGDYDPWKTEPIFHITEQEQADRGRASGEYFPVGFAAEGFTHCSFLHQVTKVAGARFHGQQALVLLELDWVRLPRGIVVEDLYGKQEKFPHVYGGLPNDAIVAGHEFPCSADGTFLLPEALRG